MHGELQLSTATLLGFLITLARVAGVFIFVPLPGMKTGMDMARIVLSVTITMALFPYWPQISNNGSIGLMALWMVSEAALGIGIGLAAAFVTEAVGVSAQIMGLQAGFAYASTIDPNTQAGSGILVVFSQLAAGMVFFAVGLDREVLRVFAASFQTTPPGSFVLTRNVVEQILATGSIMLSTGMRLALPVVAVLIMVDISLALLGRVNSQLQLLTIAFPIKMLLALAILSWILMLLPAIMRNEMNFTLSAAKGLLAR